MDFQPNTSLHLSTHPNISNNNDQLSLDLVLDPSSSSSSSPHHSPAPAHAAVASEPRIFSCNYCQRKFYSSQALGGHQNAHKLERTLAKKSRELTSSARANSGRSQSAATGAGQRGKFDSYGRRETNYRPENDEEEYNQLDLSLRL